MADRSKWSKNILVFYLIVTFVGALAGFAAVILRYLIAFFHNLLWLGKISFQYDLLAFTPPSPYGPFVILALVAGALIVAFIARRFAPEVRGSGMPYVLKDIYYRHGKMRKGLSVYRTIASAISIGSGAPVGREGPIYQIGTSLGSSIGRYFSYSEELRDALLSAGGAAGIAAAFNTPLGALVYSMEHLILKMKFRDIFAMLIAVATALYVNHLFFGPVPFFYQLYPPIPVTTVSPVVLAASALLGVIIGILSWFFIRSAFGYKEFADNRLNHTYYFYHGFSMLIVGIIIYATFVLFGHYYIHGGAFATEYAILEGTLTFIPVLLAIFVLQFVVTSIALGSGAAGGIFEPTLVLGATLGEVFGLLVAALFPGLNINPQVFAIAGMAAFFGASSGSVFGAVVLVFELTFSYIAFVPMVITAVVAYAVRRYFLEYNMYTINLHHWGYKSPRQIDKQISRDHTLDYPKEPENQ